MQSQHSSLLLIKLDQDMSAQLLWNQHHESHLCDCLYTMSTKHICTKTRRNILPSDEFDLLYTRTVIMYFFQNKVTNIFQQISHLFTLCISLHHARRYITTCKSTICYCQKCISKKGARQGRGLIYTVYFMFYTTS